MIDDHELKNLATIRWMRKYIDDLPGEGHPFILPEREGGEVIVDHSLPRFIMPLAKKGLPKGELGKMLRPLAELCHRHRSHIPEGEWTYRWFYYELLDGDGRLRPLCWIDPRLIHAQLDYKSVADGLCEAFPLPGEGAMIADAPRGSTRWPPSSPVGANGSSCGVLTDS